MGTTRLRLLSDVPSESLACLSVGLRGGSGAAPRLSLDLLSDRLGFRGGGRVGTCPMVPLFWLRDGLRGGRVGGGGAEDGASPVTSFEERGGKAGGGPESAISLEGGMGSSLPGAAGLGESWGFKKIPFIFIRTHLDFLQICIM